MLFLGLITRCKDEFYIKEFCNYYLSQGVEKIFVIDDDSHDKSIYDDISDKRIEIIYEKNIIQTSYANTLYKQIKSDFKWMIYCDMSLLACYLYPFHTMRAINRSSSFYSEKYYEKARKQSADKRKNSREPQRELYDQQH